MYGGWMSTLGQAESVYDGLTQARTATFQRMKLVSMKEELLKGVTACRLRFPLSFNDC